uniref:Uncharacterized protein n=1 Tax=Ananas comosus var. bracteatus TaxID=296719 RepID=A0A6V7P5F2_ANACO|nr:unnamed protein product [Ananas comosus var. bracteatus]
MSASPPPSNPSRNQPHRWSYRCSCRGRGARRGEGSDTRSPGRGGAGDDARHAIEGDGAHVDEHRQRRPLREAPRRLHEPRPTAAASFACLRWIRGDEGGDGVAPPPLPKLPRRLERVGRAVVAQERAHLVGNPAACIRHDHDAGLPSAATASPRPPSPPPPPPRLLLLRSRHLPAPSFPFAAAASPAPSPSPSPLPPPPRPPSPSQPPPPSRLLPLHSRRLLYAVAGGGGGGGGGGVAAHGNLAWAEVGALARRGALNVRCAERTARPGAAADPGEQGEREGGIRIARTGIVVVASVHQPSCRVLGLVDHLLILSRGRAAYCGDPRRLAAFGCPIPAGESPAEFALDAVRSSSPARRRRSPSSTPPPLRDAIAVSISQGKLVSSRGR